MADVADRRTALADAAIETLARRGMRGLTHRAVDRAANLPEGSCSNHFRTRQALLTAAVDRLLALSTQQLATVVITDPDRAVDELADIAAQWVTAGRTRMLARYELALESTRRPELRQSLTAAGLKLRQFAEQLVTQAGVANPAACAQVFVACLDGLLFDHLAGAGALDLSQERLRGVLRTMLDAARRPARNETTQISD
ncbi:TetR/AcrR family transcriptional regulator [Amycolatopsis taiwanensis]|uniref:HTH tetR-type domain-containing protein n=1 Tax=Amycolatopsis taiwanensis TaxID=342230 RepID=A0A9W6R9Y2_9PSEU|nr:TetR/AcrR family transcriptional regulator [Amycolatopsis taiwanensis]GLY70935.1 hypothetical protein Atai01_75540 [Amycolatopsis taiwanensis]